MTNKAEEKKKTEKLETKRADLAGLTHDQLYDRAMGFELKVSRAMSDQELVDALTDYQNEQAEFSARNETVSEKGDGTTEQKNILKTLDKHIKEGGVEVLFGSNYIILRKGGMEESINSSASEQDILAVANKLAA